MKPIRYQLDPIAQIGPSRDCLTKVLPGDSLEWTFKQVVDKLLDHNADGTNPPYDQGEKEIADNIKSWFDGVEKGKGTINLRAKIHSDSGADLIPVDLGKIVSSYENIVEEKSDRQEDGCMKVYNLISLEASYDLGLGSKHLDSYLP
ncbi:MAG: hypothetical protein PHG05_03320 [Candidatus Nanoarchaeia archaeon]|nr:hypothetical protein [Candidatus Nanoarchaeia archaeon]